MPSRAISWPVRPAPPSAEFLEEFGNDAPEREVSVVMPYWERGDALLASVASFAARYGASNPTVEVVVADDGSPTEPATEALSRLPPDFPFPIRVVRLPRKEIPKNPSLPINLAVEASSAPLLFLTSPECRHDRAVLGPAIEAHREAGYRSVVVCAVHDEVSGRWYSHSEYAPSRYHFANLLSRRLFDEAGGFDLDYRDGFCFDDPDLVERLDRVGAVWIDRDDLLVRHAEVPARSKVVPNRRELWNRNRELFRSKWGRDPKGAF